MKSLLVSVFWPVWSWINNPASRFIYTSYSGDLATRDSLKCRRIIESDWYKGFWGDRFELTGDQNVKTRFENDKTGFRVSAGVGGAITGEGGDFIIADDPHNIKDIHSKIKRQSVIDWWNEVMSTRLNDPKQSCRVIVMQRAHQADLAGHLTGRNGYKVLKLKGIATSDEEIISPISGETFRRREGDALWPQRFDIEALNHLKEDLGSSMFSAQIQQNPVPEGGAILKRNWWKYFSEKPELDFLLQSWDTAFKTKEENDYSACVTIGKTKIGYFLLDLWRGRLEFPELKRQFVGLYSKWCPSIVLVEDKASGQSLIQEIKRDTRIPVKAIQVDRDKVARANSVSPSVEAGKVFLDEKGKWLSDFLEETEFFPNAEHADQVDAFTQAMNYFLGRYKGHKTPRISNLW